MYLMKMVQSVPGAGLFVGVDRFKKQKNLLKRSSGEAETLSGLKIIIIK